MVELQNPCELCINYPDCCYIEKVRPAFGCEVYRPNIQVTIPRSLSFSYPNYSFVSAWDITTGFLNIAVFRLIKKKEDEEMIPDSKPIGILTVETNPLLNEFEFQQEINYKIRRIIREI